MRQRQWGTADETMRLKRLQEPSLTYLSGHEGQEEKKYMLKGCR